MTFFLNVPKKIVIFLIEAYQRTLSPDHGLFKARHPHGYCRLYPSCSQYAKEAVGRFGVVKGLFLGAKRVAICNPWTEPHVDLVPEL